MARSGGAWLDENFTGRRTVHREVVERGDLQPAMSASVMELTVRKCHMRNSEREMKLDRRYLDKLCLSGLRAFGRRRKQWRLPTMLGSQLRPVIELAEQVDECLWRFDCLIN
jgi:hypothetical protein